MEVSGYIDNLELVIRNIPNQVGRIIDEEKIRILDLNRENQLRERGVDSNDKKLQEYSHFTIDIKRLLKQPIDRTTLFHQGDFYEGFFYKYDSENMTLEIFSNDGKSPKLVEKYGREIFGLDIQNKLYLNQSIIKPKLDEWLKKYL